MFQADVPDLDVSGVNLSNYDPPIITTPGGTFHFKTSTLYVVTYICDETESYVEPDPNQPNSAYD